MNKRLVEQIDKMIENTNNITDSQLKSIDLDYLKVKRIDEFIIIMGIFDGIFLARLSEETNIFSNLTFPNKLFRCYAVLVINVDRSKYVSHRLYSFPINTEIYGSSRTSLNKTYRDVLDQLNKSPMKLKFGTNATISSKAFKCTIPVSNNNSIYFTINLDSDKEIYFDIDNFVHKYVKTEGNRAWIQDTFYGNSALYKKDILDILTCACVEEKDKLPYACLKCNNALERSACSGHHVRKCKCKLWTYFREDNCIKCHLEYSKTRYLDEVFYQPNDELNMSLVKGRRSLSNYIPYFHYNQNSAGICLGGGGSVISAMIEREINPLKLMLSFKANLAYTDQRTTMNYYHQYRDRLEPSHFDNNQEIHSQLVAIYANKKKVNTRHTFSIRCFCPQCFFYRLCLFNENIKLDLKGFDNNFPPIVTRDQFIKIYKQYLERNKSRTYHSTYIHAMIKQLTNTQYDEFVKA